MPADKPAPAAAPAADPGRIAFSVATVLAALPLTALGLSGAVASQQQAAAKQQMAVPLITTALYQVRDSGVVAIALGLALLGVGAALALRGRARIAVCLVAIITLFYATVAAFLGLHLPFLDLLSTLGR